METTVEFYEKFSWDMVRAAPRRSPILPPPPDGPYVTDWDPPFLSSCCHQTVSNTHVTIPQLMHAVITVLSAGSPRFHVRRPRSSLCLRQCFSRNSFLTHYLRCGRLLASPAEPSVVVS